MKTLIKSQIHPKMMIINPPQSVIDSNYKIVNSKDGYLYVFYENQWVKSKLATKKEYHTIPVLY